MAKVKTNKPGVGLRSIMVNFDFGKLLKKLDGNKDFLVTEKLKVNAAKNTAKQMVKNIKSGNFTNNIIKPSTKYIRTWRGRSPSPPLQDTGKMVKSIRHSGKDIEINAKNSRGEYYGHYHLEGYRIKKNEFTDAFNIKPGTRVPKRDFINGIKGFSESMKIDKKVRKGIIDKINRSLKTKTRRIGVKK